MQKSLENTVVCVAQELRWTEQKNPTHFLQAELVEAGFGAAAANLQLALTNYHFMQLKESPKKLLQKHCTMKLEMILHLQ